MSVNRRRHRHSSVSTVMVRVEQPPSQVVRRGLFRHPGAGSGVDRITLRRRTGGGDAGWHLKLPAGPDARTEVRAPLGAEHDPPAELIDVVLAIVRDHPVAPVARISTTREVQLLHGPDDAALAEFCDDHVSAGQGADGSIAAQSWREWELELVGAAADADLMDTLCDRLLDTGRTRLGTVPSSHGYSTPRPVTQVGRRETASGASRTDRRAAGVGPRRTRRG